MATQEQLLHALQTVIDPNTGRDFVTSKALKNLTVTDGEVTFDVELGYPAKSQIAGFRKALIAATKGVADCAVPATRQRVDIPHPPTDAIQVFHLGMSEAGHT